MNIEKQMPELKPNDGQMPMVFPSAPLAANPLLCDANNSIQPKLHYTTYDTSGSVRDAFHNLWNQQN